MLIGHFTEQPWQDDTTGLMGTQSLDLSISNGVYDPKVGAQLYNRYLDEKVYAEEMGFDASCSTSTTARPSACRVSRTWALPSWRVRRRRRKSSSWAIFYLFGMIPCGW